MLTQNEINSTLKNYPSIFCVPIESAGVAMYQLTSRGRRVGAVADEVNGLTDREAILAQANRLAYATA